MLPVSARVLMGSALKFYLDGISRTVYATRLFSYANQVLYTYQSK